MKNRLPALLFFAFLIFFTACDKDDDKVNPEDLPQLETLDASNVTATTARLSANILDKGDSDIVESGFCWSLEPGADGGNAQCMQVDFDSISFSEVVLNLSFNTTYFVVAYALNNSGMAFGNEINFTTEMPEIGDRGPGGGLIFHLDEQGFGLEAAPFLQSLSARWGCGGTTISIANQKGVGKGFENTKAIVKVCPTIGIAARVSDNLVLNGYSDWYLPSLDELRLVYENLHLEELGNFGALYYWSSSQEDGGRAWVINFYTGTEHAYNKAFESRAHAIRTF